MHPEKPDSRDDPDVGEPGADEVEGITPVGPGRQCSPCPPTHLEPSFLLVPVTST